MSHGKICYLEIPAMTAEASADFYGTIFGWTIRKRGAGELAFDMVDDISDTLEKIEAAGGRVLTSRTDIAPGVGAFAVFADPAGAEFGLYEEPKG